MNFDANKYTCLFKVRERQTLIRYNAYNLQSIWDFVSKQFGSIQFMKVYKRKDDIRDVTQLQLLADFNFRPLNKSL